MATVTGFCVVDSPIGPCGLAWAGTTVIGTTLPEGDFETTLARMRRRFPDATQAEPPPAIAAVVRRMQAALGGAPDDLLDVALDMQHVGAFEREVYAATRAIPFGATTTYGELAASLGQPGAARAVGQALGRNPFAPVVPCHRVLAAGQRSGGFSADGGVATKLRLLDIERARFGQPGLFDG